MSTATINGLQVNYLVQGSGPHLLMLAPGGFNSTIESWTRGGVWKEMDALNTLSKSFTVIPYDRREAGISGGRVEKLTWETFARRTTAGDWEETGRETLKRQRRGLLPETPVRPGEEPAND